MRSFLRKEDGYVFIMMLLFMPVFVGFALLVIDVGRANNASSDLQAAADAMALAGARELDQSPDAITRANAAMQTLGSATSANTVRFATNQEGFSGEALQYFSDGSAGNDYTVIFLKQIPASDDAPIDQAWVNANGTNLGVQANYVYVRVNAPKNLQSLFFNPASLLNDEVPIAAEAVATGRTVLCKFPPIFMCNPFEVTSIPSGSGLSYQEYNRRELVSKFEQGFFHGRMLRLHPKGPQTAYAGNFGFLQVPKDNGTLSSSADTIRSYFAGTNTPACFSELVATKPGAATSIRQGIGTRFNTYSGKYNAQNSGPPSLNVRKSYLLSNTNQACSGSYNTETYEPVSGDPAERKTLGFTTNSTMTAPGQTGGTVDTSYAAEGAYVGSGTWDFDTYMEVNYRDLPSQDGTLDGDGDSLISDADFNAIKNAILTDPKYNSGLNSAGQVLSGVTTVLGTMPQTAQPSRYDVYRFELEYTAKIRKDRAGTISTNSLPLYLHHSRWGGAKGLDNFAETGASICGQPPSFNPETVTPLDVNARYNSRRVIPIAIIDCLSPDNTGSTGQSDLVVNRYGKVFMTNPMEKNGNIAGTDAENDAGTINNDSTINIELIGVEGAGNGEPVDDVLIQEAYLVR